MSYEKRHRRKLKMDAILRGADPLGGGVTVAGDDSPPAWVERREKCKEKYDSYLPAYYEAPDHGRRPAKDEDNWDIPPAEVARLSLLFPKAVKVVNT